jgi:hypothetical protein
MIGIGVGVVGGIGSLAALWRFVLLPKKLDKLRQDAAKHHNWDDVLKYGEKQAAMVSSPDRELAHDLGQALAKKGREEEAFAYALQVQKLLTQESNPLWAPSHDEDYGEVSAFFNASAHYLRSMELLGNIYLQRNRAEEAKEIFEYLAGLGGRKANRNLPLAEALVRLKDGAGAAAALRKFMATVPGKANEVKHCLPQLVSYLPEDEALRGFEAEFLKVQGLHKTRLEELSLATAAGEIAKGELTLFHALSETCGEQKIFSEALSKGAKALSSKPGMSELLGDYARQSGAADASISKLEEDWKNGKDILGDCLALVNDSASELSARTRGLHLLLRAGCFYDALAAAHRFPTELGTPDLREVTEKILCSARAQRIAEARNMLAEKRQPVKVNFGGVEVSPRPGASYAYFLNGNSISEEDKPALQYSLAGDLIATGGDSGEITKLLQKASTGSSHLATAARLRLARALYAEDRDTALQYLDNTGSLVDAAARAREGVLDDGYELGCLLENDDPARAGTLFNDLCLIDLQYRDAKKKRDSLRVSVSAKISDDSLESLFGNSEGKTERYGKKEASEIAEPELGVTALLAGFDSKVASPSSAGNFISGAVQCLDEGDLLDNRYELVSTLGEGGMGCVFRAYDRRLKREVAVKLMTAGGALIGQAQARFELEAQLAGKLFQNPGVVTVLDMSDGPPPYIVMELVKGKSLKELIEQNHLTPEKIVRILAQVAEVLAHAHEMEIIHRDIKPANILVEENTLKTKVADFGLAKTTGADLGLTQSGSILGTCLYMSPEQIRGKSLDGRTDIYSLGIMAYEMCCGRPPFIEGEITYQHVHVEPEPLAEKVKDFPPALLELIMQCLAKKADDRPEDCREIKERLDEIYHALKGKV